MTHELDKTMIKFVIFRPQSGPEQSSGKKKVKCGEHFSVSTAFHCVVDLRQVKIH